VEGCVEDGGDMNEHRMPSLPKSVLTHGLVGRYVELMTPLYEGPPEFHFGAAMAIISAALPNVTLEWAESGMHLNLYTILVGSTGTSKTAIRRAATDIFTYRNLEGAGGDRKLVAACEDVHQIRSIGSAEGIEDELLAASARIRAMSETSNEAVPALLNLDEFTSYLKKAAARSTSNFAEFMIWAYDTIPNFRRPLAGKASDERLPLLMMSLSSDTTPSAFREQFKGSDTRSGFFNRLDLYTGERGSPVPRVHPVDRRRMESDVLEPLSIAIDNANRKSGGSVLTISDEAGMFHDEHYITHVYSLMNDENAELFKRYSTKVLKYAGLFCILDGVLVITLEHIKLGIAVADYLVNTATLFGGTIGETERSQALAHIVRRAGEAGPFRVFSDGSKSIAVKHRNYAKANGGLRKLIDELFDNEELIPWPDPSSNGYAHPDATNSE
jgi:hypothetical protein